MEAIKINEVNLYRTKPRLRWEVRKQEDIRPRLIENLIEEDHRLMLVWDFVEGLDLSELYDQIKSVEGLPGSPAIDPKILMAVWLYAILDHEISARKIAELCEQHNAYIWLCGGVKINHHTLSDFYTAHEQWLNKQFTLHLLILKHQGLIDLDRVAQDFISVRACAGADSFRREKTLESCLKEADEYLEKLRREREDNPASFLSADKQHMKGLHVNVVNVCVKLCVNYQKSRHRYKKKKIVRKLVFPQLIQMLGK